MDFIKTMHPGKNILPIILLAGMIAGCASTSSNGSNNRAGVQQAAAFQNTMPFRFAAEQNGDAVHFLVSIAFINKMLEPIPYDNVKLDWSELSIYDSKDSLIWYERKTITGRKSETSMAEVVQMTAYDDYAWKPSGDPSRQFSGKARVKAYQVGNVMVFDSTISFTYVPAAPKPLSLHIDIEPQDNRQFLINLTVTRAATVEHEFLPSSLTHDYKIYDSQGTLLWQMSYQKMYMQMITDVAPKNIGEKAYYTDVWSGEGNVVPGFVPSGEYKLVAIIPCKPEAIEDSVLFKIK